MVWLGVRLSLAVVRLKTRSARGPNPLGSARHMARRNPSIGRAVGSPALNCLPRPVWGLDPAGTAALATTDPSGATGERFPEGEVQCWRTWHEYFGPPE